MVKTWRYDIRANPFLAGVFAVIIGVGSRGRHEGEVHGAASIIVTVAS